MFIWFTGGFSQLNPFYKNLALWLVIGLMMLMLLNVFNQPDAGRESISYSEFWNMVESGNVTAVTIQGENITGINQIGGGRFGWNERDILRYILELQDIEMGTAGISARIFKAHFLGTSTRQQHPVSAAGIKVFPLVI